MVMSSNLPVNTTVVFIATLTISHDFWAFGNLFSLLRNAIMDSLAATA